MSLRSKNSSTLYFYGLNCLLGSHKFGVLYAPKFMYFVLSFPLAIDLINNLLQVKMRKRYSVDKSLSHPWLQVKKNVISLWQSSFE